MGKYTVKMQKDPGERSRLWDTQDFEEVMVNNTGTKAIEAIWIYGARKLSFSKKAMKNMKRLRILYIYNFHAHDDSTDQYLSNNLCWFECSNYPWESLPEDFEPKRLVSLALYESSLHHLWIGTKHLPSLRWLDLGWSYNLMRTPDFTGMPNLEELNLYECRSLQEVHHSLQCCRKLIKLDLGRCKSLERFPYVNVESLEYLNLERCCKLEKFPDILGRMKPELRICVIPSGIREVPPSILQHQTHLTELYCFLMDDLVALPSSIGMLKGLVKLNVSYCSKLESLPEEIGDLQNLERLEASHTLISRPPSSIVRLNKLKHLDFRENKIKGVFFVFPQLNEGLRSLEFLDLSYCNLIDGGLPEDIGCLSSLEELNLTGNNFEHLPRSIAQLGALQSLNLNECKRLKVLPGFMRMPNLEKLDLSYCNLIDGGLPEDIGCLSSLKVLDLSGNNFEHLPRSIAQLGALRSLHLSSCKRLKELPEFPEQLDRIDANWSNYSICNSLFQNISSLQHVISASDSLSLRVFSSWVLEQGGYPRLVPPSGNWYKYISQFA